MSGEDRKRRRSEVNRRVCAIFDACRNAGSARGLRDAALVCLLFGADLERERALTLSVRAYDPGTGELRAGGRLVRATEGARRTLGEWLGLRGPDRGPLVCRLSGEGRPTLRSLTSPDVDRILAERARSAGVEEYDPEAFRKLYRSPWWEKA